jgi:hypothetical protein
MGINLPWYVECGKQPCVNQQHVQTIVKNYIKEAQIFF